VTAILASWRARRMTSALNELAKVDIDGIFLGWVYEAWLKIKAF